MAEAGVPQADIGRVLNHAIGSRVMWVYARYEGDAEKRVTLERWAHLLRRILKGTPAAREVVPLG